MFQVRQNLLYWFFFINFSVSKSQNCGSGIHTLNKITPHVVQENVAFLIATFCYDFYIQTKNSLLSQTVQNGNIQPSFQAFSSRLLHLAQSGGRG